MEQPVTTHPLAPRRPAVRPPVHPLAETIT